MNENDFSYKNYDLADEQEIEFVIEFKPRSRKKNDLFHKYPKRIKSTCTKFSFGRKYLTLHKNGKVERILIILIKKFKAEQPVSVNVRAFEWRESI